VGRNARNLFSSVKPILSTSRPCQPVLMLSGYNGMVSSWLTCSCYAATTPLSQSNNRHEACHVAYASDAMASALKVVTLAVDAEIFDEQAILQAEVRIP